MRILFVLALLLTACAAKEDIDLTALRSGQSGLRVSAAFAREIEFVKGTPAVRSSVYAGMTLSKIMPDHIPPAQNKRTPQVGNYTDAELLDVFITLLKTDIQELLNSARNRTSALEMYISSLESHVQEGHIRLRALSDKEEDLQDDQDRLRNNVRDLRKELDTAIREGAAGSTEAITKDLLTQQTTLAETETNLIVTAGLVDAYDDILEPLTERLEAIQENRNALIKGVKVIDIRGIEDLGILEEKDGVPRIRRRR